MKLYFGAECRILKRAPPIPPTPPLQLHTSCVSPPSCPPAAHLTFPERYQRRWQGRGPVPRIPPRPDSPRWRPGSGPGPEKCNFQLKVISKNASLGPGKGHPFEGRPGPPVKGGPASRKTSSGIQTSRNTVGSQKNAFHALSVAPKGHDFRASGNTDTSAEISFSSTTETHPRPANANDKKRVQTDSPAD